MLWCGVLGIVSACTGNDHGRMDVAAPLPPQISNHSYLQKHLIEPASGGMQAEANLNAAPSKGECSFSSFQRKHTIGYELDESRQIAFKASPSFDVWNPSDVDMKFSLRFTKALGGAANKRPKCTYSGYYGLLPYIKNDGLNIGRITDQKTIKSFVQEKLDERAERNAAKAEEI
jgi:hypothetical protein